MSCCKKTCDSSKVVKEVQEYYGKELTGSESLATNACCLGEVSVPSSHRKILSEIHEQVIAKFYGCGSPIPYGMQDKDLIVVDLGCGTGRDVYLASGIIGAGGKVIGVDMTKEQLSVAQQYQEYHAKVFGGKHNTEFRLSRMEDLSFLADNSVDVVISNCVLNLVPDKRAALAEIFRVLKDDGGELYFSDVFTDRRVPESLAQDRILWGECLSGALYLEDFRRILVQEAGINDYRMMPGSSQVTIGNKALEDQISKVSDVKFYSHTVRVFKLKELEDRPEDYGQVATYLGGITESPETFVLDKDYSFKVGVPVRVCGNTAAMLEKTRLAEFFRVTKRGNHLGKLQL